ncbi:MAG: PKD domain-containing protein [Candidatus Eisenbacteria bacterium]|uniref:PKD domain-containing protein n=1 Tax=Eiseniibacteriota bacterium TaxID=2212470 RepID=A0A849T0F4_UNCEI|nr:PKD domain-containing protein [Candidatus Eisenbacteria bacterium]
MSRRDISVRFGYLMLAAAACLIGERLEAAGVYSNPLFVEEKVTPGFVWTLPTALAFLPGGRMLVTEKGGRVYSVVNGVKRTTPLLDISSEVLDNVDRGLLGLAIDPNYLANHYVYLMYTVDPDSNGNENNDDAFGRLARFQVSFADSNVIPYSSRTVLFGHTWTSGAVSTSGSHTIGCLRFAPDGTLMVSVGDGAQFSGPEDGGGLDAGAFGAGRTNPLEDIGAFRAQYLSSLCGKILRIDPATGFGVPSNPFYEAGSPSSIKSRIWGYGHRNPFRFTIRPGTGVTDASAGNPGVLFIGDVGSSEIEELDISTGPGRNFGWPCYEGPTSYPEFQFMSPPRGGCATIGTPANPSSHTPPTLWWSHANGSISNPVNVTGNASVSGIFYTGTRYPAQYQGAMFYFDYGQSWCRVATVNASHQITGTSAFATNLEGPVDFALEPVTGDILYISIAPDEIRRIRFIGLTGNEPPVAAAAATPSTGVAPLAVNFSSAGSFDPNSDPFTIAWAFGDGQGSNQAAPSHLYTNPGSYDAILTLTDDDGNIGRDTATVVVFTNNNFPSTAVLDSFDRANGAIGGSWVDQTNGLTINNNALTQSCCSPTTVWSGQSFGPNQEAYLRFGAVTPGANEQDLMLKVQGLSYTTGHIEVRYDAAVSQVKIATYLSSTGWTQRGAFAATMAPGDQFGARALSNGLVQVFKNGGLIGQATTGNWPFTANGGYLGLTFDGALLSRLDDFGGGNVVIDPNAPPEASIQTPANLSHYVTDLPVVLSATAFDSEDPLDSLRFNWDLTLHHNNHTHPSLFFSTQRVDTLIPDDHDDGTGVWIEIELRVTDKGGATDTVRRFIYPEIDLQARPAWVLPATPVAGAPITIGSWIRNGGRMPAPISRWRLRIDNNTWAERDTLMIAGDSVLVQVQLPANSLAAGSHTLRFVADTLGTVVETNESNNAYVQALVVQPGGATDVGALPFAMRLSEARPNPASGPVALALELPHAARVSFDVFDAQGRLVHRQAEATFAAGMHGLIWKGVLPSGGPAPAGVYLAAVRVDGRRLVKRFAMVR